MIQFDILGESRYKFDRRRVKGVVEATLARHGVKDAEVGVVVVGERKMRALHKKYMGGDEVAEVLSFPLEDSPSAGSGQVGFAAYPDGILRLGDVVVCYPQAVKLAAAGNLMVDEEIAMLVEHGCLHLLGIHHD